MNCQAITISFQCRHKILAATNFPVIYRHSSCDIMAHNARQRLTSTRNRKAPFLDTTVLRFSAMHSKEMGVEFYMFHNKPYDFNCVVTLTLYIYIYIYIHIRGEVRK